MTRRPSTRADLLAAMPERELQRQVAELARLFGWKFYHTWRSDHSAEGFPDVVLAREKVDGTAELIFAELKTQTGRVTQVQEDWLRLLSKVPGIYVGIWRPSDRDEIERVLK